jgi:ribosome-associated protein
MIRINRQIQLNEQELEFVFVRASGPGGQNVNKVATAAQMRFDIKNSPSLPEHVKQRLIKLAGHRVTQDGVLQIDARRYRSQERNRQDAINRLVQLITQATHVPKKRVKTRPSRAQKQKRLNEKRHRSQRKRLRGRPLDD